MTAATPQAVAEPAYVLDMQAPDALALQQLAAELRSARSKHPQPFNSAHEGLAVIREEYIELETEVFKGGHEPRSHARRSAPGRSHRAALRGGRLP